MCILFESEVKSSVSSYKISCNLASLADKIQYLCTILFDCLCCEIRVRLLHASFLLMRSHNNAIIDYQKSSCAE